LWRVDVQSRHAALAKVQALVARAAAGEDPENLRQEQVLHDFAELIAVTDLSADLEAAHALGWLHWYRYESTEPASQAHKETGSKPHI
jgi:hypothetical protein